MTTEREIFIEKQEMARSDYIADNLGDWKQEAHDRWFEDEDARFDDWFAENSEDQSAEVKEIARKKWMEAQEEKFEAWFAEQIKNM